MIVIEITASTFGDFTINGNKRIILPGDRITIKPKDGDVIRINIAERDIFKDEREAFNLLKNPTLFENDN